jgi:uracil-DNA glycosylase family protein
MSAQSWVPAGAGIEELRGAAAGCQGCELWEPATQVVFSAGNPRARLMLVGEQPGDQEDRRGIPFVGPAGQLLQRALAEAGIGVAGVYVTNAVKHFRFTESGARRIHATPQGVHLKACRPWLEAEISQVDPRLVVCLGASAAKSLLGPAFRLTQQRGTLLELPPPFAPRPVLATLHPSAVLRTQAGPEHDQAFAGLVADLRTAAAEVAG